MKKLDLRTGKPCMICSKTSTRGDHTLCGLELDRRKREQKIGFGELTQVNKENGIKNGTRKKYLAGHIAPFMRY